MRKILVADDDPTILALLATALGKNYRITVATDGEEAIKKALEEWPDLIITDVVMPKKNGFEVCSTIRFNSQLCDVPIIMLTGLGRDEDKLQGFRMGADDFIVKPFSVPELRQCVERLLERSTRVEEKRLPIWEEAQEIPKDRIPMGIKKVDALIGGGLPIGANILFIGPVGSGKSSFCRNFIVEGLKRYEKCMIVAIDDNPAMVRKKLEGLLGRPPLDYYEVRKLFTMVDAYSWSAGIERPKAKVAAEGLENINHLARAIADAGIELGQNPMERMGGRRVLDSISTLFINFPLDLILHFLTQLSRATATQGGVTTIFVLEEGTVEEKVINNVKYLMDGVFESRVENGKTLFRVASMKWIQVPNQWINLA